MSIRSLSKELAEKARLELNEDPNRVANDIQHIKDWLAKQPHLKARTDDQWLLAFLRGCKFSLERTKEKLDLYYSVRTTAPELFRVKPTDKIFKEILESGNVMILPNTEGPASPRVVIMRPGSCDPDKYKTSDVMACMNLLHRIMLIDDDNTTIAGSLSLIDLEGVTMGHFLQWTPSLMKKMVVISQDAAPIRMKGAHYINTPPGFETVYNAVNLLINEKNRRRNYVHNKNYEEMYKYFPKNILPVEYGGNAGTIQEIIDYWKKKVEEYNDWLLEDMHYGTDESKRLGKPKTSEDMFGVEGSFRKLDFD